MFTFGNEQTYKQWTHLPLDMRLFIPNTLTANANDNK